MNVELIYFSDCPNISLARDRLSQAFALSGLAPQWQEWERSDPAAPDHVRAWGSPTILVNGRDVTGMAPLSDDAGACRVYALPSGAFDGAPAVETIAAMLQTSDATATRSGWRSSVASLPALGAAALPKLTCPACWPAYSGLMSSLGVGFLNYTPFLLPLSAAFLLISLAALGWRAKRRRGYGPLGLGMAASAVLLIGKFGYDSDAAMYTGIATLAVASAWNAWPRSRRVPGDCPSCVPATDPAS